MRNDNEFGRTRDRNEEVIARDTGDVTPRLAPLGDLDDFQVAEGHPDVRGWDVLGADGQKLGKVHELIVDTREMRTRYLDVTLDRKAVGLDHEHDVLVPIGTSRVDDDNDHIILDTATVTRLATLPAYDHKQFTREYEDDLLPRFGATPVGGAGADYYSGRHFDDSEFYRDRGGRDASIARRASDSSSAQSARADVGDREIRVPVEEERARTTERTNIDRDNRIGGTDSGLGAR